MEGVKRYIGSRRKKVKKRKNNERHQVMDKGIIGDLCQSDRSSTRVS
jgi:hypothetical protein